MIAFWVTWQTVFCVLTKCAGFNTRTFLEGLILKCTSFDCTYCVLYCRVYIFRRRDVSGLENETAIVLSGKEVTVTAVAASAGPTLPSRAAMRKWALSMAHCHLVLHVPIVSHCTRRLERPGALYKWRHVELVDARRAAASEFEAEPLEAKSHVTGSVRHSTVQ